MADDIETRLRERPENNPEVARMDISGRLVVAIKRLMNAHRLQDEAADTIARLRADLRAALEALKQIADYPSQHLWGGNSHAMGRAEGHRVCAEIARKILASHKENTDG